ncbi:pyrroline-5-carboxylate reductase [Glaciecola sp. MH2013]|uniref:pyrroline-5-carboxylate reductase n=1 Tax=Glaciecola sp. MH2013 TaxID=2785524 RepID=UPI00189FB31D|nr:pyrroline-5-carboxylate reductase [Glaciecola sp. MH2013]MBF7071995.1 pyrroline-5-carboxylate reductase [Glaciecola sp. MH2013]
MQARRLSFIGAGNMPRSIISGLVKGGYDANLISASNPSTPKLEALSHHFGINTTQSNYAACDFADVVILSVKPQIMAQTCADLIAHCDISGKLMVSIAAGITTDRLIEMLGGHTNVVRTMPNTPSALSMGMTGLYAPKTVNNADKEFVASVMKHVGEILWVDSDEKINTVIAAAGSSPAYFFLFAQAMQDEVIRQGLNKDDARLLVQQALLGSAQMICDNPTLELSELRAQVTSKGGTTHEAISSFQESNLEAIVSKAMRAAITRATEMANDF